MDRKRRMKTYPKTQALDLVRENFALYLKLASTVPYPIAMEEIRLDTCNAAREKDPRSN